MWDKYRSREGDIEHLFGTYYLPGTMHNGFHTPHLIFRAVLSNIR